MKLVHRKPSHCSNTHLIGLGVVLCGRIGHIDILYIDIFSLQKLLSDERFVSVETDSDEKQLLNQMLNAVKVTPSLNEDLQVEVMKVGVSHTSVLTTEMHD